MKLRFYAAMVSVVMLLAACGTAYNLRSEPYSSGVEKSISGTPEQVEARLKALVDSGELDDMGRETHGEKVYVFLETGTQMNLTSGQRGVKTGLLYRVVYLPAGDGVSIYVLAQEKFGFSDEVTRAAASQLALQLAGD